MEGITPEAFIQFSRFLQSFDKTDYHIYQIQGIQSSNKQKDCFVHRFTNNPVKQSSVKVELNSF